MATSTCTWGQMREYNGEWNSWESFGTNNFSYAGSSKYATKIKLTTKSDWVGTSSSLSFTIGFSRAGSSGAKSGTFYVSLCSSDPGFTGTSYPSSYLAKSSVGWSASDLQTHSTGTCTIATSAIQPGTTYYLYITSSQTVQIGGSSSYFSGPTVTYSVPTYTVSYNANGGSGAPSSQTKTHGTDLKISSTVPTKTGYTFKQWVSTRAGQKFYFNPGSTTAFNGDQELIAEWEENILTVNYYSGGATSGTLYEEEIQDLTALLGVSEFKYSKEEEHGLWDVQWEKWLYLEKQNYKPTGYWLYGEQRIDQSWPCTGQQLAESLGLDISTRSLAIDVVPEWERAASVITVYNEAGEPLRGVVHIYNNSGDLCYGIITVYDEKGIGRLAV